jgi:hypothetical protein
LHTASAVASAASRLHKTLTTTSALHAAGHSDVARPLPRLPPLTSAVFPSSDVPSASRHKRPEGRRAGGDGQAGLCNVHRSGSIAGPVKLGT